MKVALPIWDDRISPVFDVAGELLVAETNRGSVRSQTIRPMNQVDPTARAQAVAGDGIEVLICGAISKALEQLLEARGVRVISRKRGEAIEVLNAYLAGHLDDSQFAMPGCNSAAAHTSSDETDNNELHLTCCDEIEILLHHSEDRGLQSERRWAAMVGAQRVGELRLQHDENEGHVEHFHVERNWQQSPAPCRLLQEALSYCRQRGLVKVTVETSLTSRRAIRLFTCLGFQRNRRQSNRRSRPPEFYLNLYRNVDEARCVSEFNNTDSTS